MRTFKPIFITLCILWSIPLSMGQCFEDPSGSGNFVTALGEPCVNTIITAVPFLRIAPDARAAGMGDTGIATTPDANALHFNASKLVFSEKKGGVALSYTPWLRALDVNDVYLGYLSGFLKLGKEKKQIIGLSTRYFSLGEIELTDENGLPIGTHRPNEWEINAAYASQLSKNFSLGVSGKYIFSDLASGFTVGGDTISAGTSGAIDLSLSYKKQYGEGATSNYLFLGAALTNIGTKITYTNSINKDFIPTNLGIGIAWITSLTNKHRLTMTMDVNKLLAPTPDPSQADTDGDGVPDYKQVSTIKSIFNSFGDAPGGIKEEFREISISWGIEYLYANAFALRTGYFHEHATKGNRQYFTLGIGGQYRSFGLNASYLIPTTSQRNPLDNTFRVSVLHDFKRS